MMTYNLPSVTDFSDLRTINRQNGQHWFDPDTMRFFKCKLARSFRVTDDGAVAVFVSSEQGPDNRRLFSVRAMSLRSGHVETAYGFQAFTSSARADKAAKHVTRILDRKHHTAEDFYSLVRDTFPSALAASNPEA